MVRESTNPQVETSLKVKYRGHYQTRPRRYTQYLHLATSIISDLRIDQPRKPRLWSVDGGKERDSADWGVEEMRALAGAYYLSSK
jgi:hypothetical protein